MFSNVSTDDVTCISNRLSSQASRIRSDLQKLDNDLSAAVEAAEKCVSNNCIVALLAMVQCVNRDASNDFRPIASDDVHTTELNAMADEALLTLTELYAVGEAYLKSHGWHPIEQSNTVSGGIVYERNETAEVSEEPNVDMSWMMRLMLSIPILIEPGCMDGKVVWAATVVYYHHAGGGDAEMQYFDLESNNSCVSVLDVLKSDGEDPCTRLRGTYNGSWRGLYAEAMGEMDANSTIGQHLELWTETTLAGMCTNQESSRILVIGLAGGQLISFLHKHILNVELTVVEESQRMVDITVDYFDLPSFLLDCVSVVNPTEYVKSRCLDTECSFDTIIVNVCSGDEAFPTKLLHDEFFNGLITMLSNHPNATLIVNSGSSIDTVFKFVEDSCNSLHGHRSGHSLILREYLLRDHTEDNNEGAIVAARRRQWSLTVEDWQREHMGEDAQLSGAMDVTSAQQTQVVRLEKFLSLEDIELIHRVAKIELTSMTKGLDVHTDSWRVLYLHNNNLFQQKLPALRQRILDTIREVDRNNWRLFDNVEHVNIRVVEYHQMDEFGELSDPKHYDLNSLLTMDIMLSDEGSFEGGDLQTYEADGTLKKHEFQQGDALIFVSHKYHCVGRVTSGRRNVMVLEFWYGPERQCPHRCERFGKEICSKDPGQHPYTQQFHPEKIQNPEPDNASFIPLPFRLGSVSTCKGECKILELLWEPNESDEEVILAKPIPVADVKELSDAFACFGSDSDEDGF